MNPPDVASRFTFYEPDSPEKRELHTSIRSECEDLGEWLDERLPDGREKSLVLTKLEEVMLWANAAVARSKQ